MEWVPEMEHSQSTAFTSTTRRSGRSATNSYWRRQAEKFGGAQGYGFLASDFNLEPETFGQYATPARLLGVLVKPAAPTFRHGASVGCFDYVAGSR